MADVKNNKKKKKKKKILIFSILGAVILLIIIAAVVSGNKEKIITIQTEPVVNRNITQVVSGTGVIQPEKKVDISAEVSGEIIDLPVKEGQDVSKGDLLVRIKPDIYKEIIQQEQAGVNYSKSQVDVMQNNLKKAELDYDRTLKLYNTGMISQSDLDNAKTVLEVSKSNLKSAIENVKQSQAQLRQSSETLYKTTIKSPMDGTVTQLNNELGEKVVGTQQFSGTVIMTVSDLSAMEADIEISENDITQVQIGDTAKIQVDAFPDREIKGTVFEIANTAKTKGAGTQEEIVNFVVKLRIIDKDVELKPGMSCNADIKVNSKINVLSVPIQAITVREEQNEKKPEDNPDEPKRTTDETQKKKEKPKEIVFVIDPASPQKVKIMPVKSGISDDKYIEITEGLQPDMVVVKGPYKAISKDLENGTKIKVDNNTNKPPQKTGSD